MQLNGANTSFNGYTGLSKEVASSHTLRQSVNEMLKYANAGHAYSLWYSWLLNRAPLKGDENEEDFSTQVIQTGLNKKTELKNRRTAKQLIKFRKLL